MTLVEVGTTVEAAAHHDVQRRSLGHPDQGRGVRARPTLVHVDEGASRPRRRSAQLLLGEGLVVQQAVTAVLPGRSQKMCSCGSVTPSSSAGTGPRTVITLGHGAILTYAAPATIRS